MPAFRLALLGPLQLYLAGNLVTQFPTAKVQALLAYLAVEAQTPHARDTLIGLFWPDYTPESARQNLRQTLFRLRQVVPPELLLVTNQTVQFNPAGDYRLDVTTFTDLITACHRHAHTEHTACADCSECLQQAVELYRGDFLTGFFLNDSPAFEEWLLLRREWLRREALQALAALAVYHERAGTYAQAQVYAWRQVELDPAREEAHQQLMRVLALSGRRSEALAQYESCRRLLAEELGVEPSAETLAIYEQIRAGEIGKTPGSPPPAVDQAVALSPAPLDLASPAPSITLCANLPKPSTPFVERRTELTEILRQLRDPACRLLTLVGHGGMGKTRLALEAARRLLEEEPVTPDGVCFVALEALATLEQMAPAIVTALGLPVASQSDPRSQLLAFLGEKQLLLLLDNFEHLLDGVALVTDILAEAPNVKLLVTSRTALALQEEWFHPIGGMDLPDANAHAPEEVEAASAVQLFLQCARRARPGFALATEMARVVQICRLVDGMPLALELAAAWLRSLTCAQIVIELQSSLDLLATTLRNVPQRHRSMQAVFDQSWQLLDEEERRVLSQFVVFEGGFDWEAAKTVTGVTISMLTTLVEHSWLQVREEGRYDLHPLVRSYLLVKLNTQYASLFGETTDQVRNRHSLYYAALDLNTPTVGEREAGNLRAGWLQATQQLDVATLMRYLDQAIAYNFFLGADELLVVTLTRAHNALDDTMTIMEPAALHQLIAWLHYVSSRTFDAAGQLQQAAHAAQRCLDYFARCPGAALDDEMRDGLLCQLAGILIAQGRFAEADEIAESVLTRAQQADDQKHQIWTFYLLGMSAIERGRYETANTYLHQSLAIQVMRQERYTLGIYTSLAEVAYLRGNYALTAQLLNEAEASWGIELPLRLENQIQWARCEIATGELMAAHARCLAALRKACELAAQGLRGAALNELGRIALLEQQLDEAGRFFEQAAVYADKMEWHKGEARARIGLGHVALAQAKFDEAATHFHRAIAITWSKAILPEVLGAIIGLAEIAAQAGKQMQAAAWLRMAVDHSATPHYVRVQAAALLQVVDATLPAPLDDLVPGLEEVVAELVAANEKLRASRNS